MFPALRFVRQFLRPLPGAVGEEQGTCLLGDEVLRATFFRPARSGRSLPGWVVLHGLTYAGKDHPSLVPFARAVAASGAVVCSKCVNAASGT